MNTEYLLIDDGCDGQEIKDFSEGAPDIEGPVFFDALIIEAIDLGDEPGLVVSSEEGDSVFVPDFQGQQQQECFDAISASVHIVTQKYVIGVGRISANFEQLKQVVQLPVDISTNSDWGSNLDYIGLVLQDFLGRLTQFLDGDLLHLLLPLDLLDDVLDHFPRRHANYQILSN